MKRKGRIITKKEIEFWLRVLKYFYKSGFDIEKSIHLIEKLLNRYNEPLYSVTIQRFNSEIIENDEIILLNSLDMAKSIADSISSPILDILHSNLNPLKKVDKIIKEGEIGRVFDKNMKILIYENKKVFLELEELVQMLDSLSGEDIIKE